jgi:hypothetical protein
MGSEDAGMCTKYTVPSCWDFLSGDSGLGGSGDGVNGVDFETKGLER